MHGYAALLKPKKRGPPQLGRIGSGSLKKGFASLSRYSNPHKTHSELGSSRIVLRSSRDRVSRGNESIPSPRHPVETAPKEQSIWLTCGTSLVRRSCRAFVTVVSLL